MLYIVDQVIIMATLMKITQQCGCLFYKQKSPREEAYNDLRIKWTSALHKNPPFD